MKKILSIDFDIIMSPCIQLYNNYSTDDWEALCSHFEILKFAKPDYIHFKRLLQLLLKLSKSMKKENIHFIVSHEMIATYVDENIDDTISLINIDHHHDIAYVDKDVENKIEYLNCGNWVKYLSEKGKLENYVWIKNEDSTDYTEDIKFNFSSIPIIECNLETIDTPDELFICLSPQWIPPHLRCLFYIIVDIFNSIYDTEFKIQGDEKDNGRYI